LILSHKIQKSHACDFGDMKTQWLQMLWLNNPQNGSNLNCRNRNLNNDDLAFGMTLVEVIIMNNTPPYEYLYSMGNLILAWRKARKGKTHRKDVIEFEENLEKNLLELHNKLKNKTYTPLPLTTFPVRDPKTRLISKADFRDRVVHHALILVIGQTFEKGFIYDSCANQKGKGTSFAMKRLEKFQREVTKNFSQHAFCLKADVRHYFDEVDHEVLLAIIKRKITDNNIIWLIEKILSNTSQIGGGAFGLEECRSEI
jgi:hypothetical protein